ncbi:hypothetical protein CVU37_06895 [candidate division BRC1 bacterium HGW-BRC1-1]|jgi:hypothetical protein|nr:MAG: hypothetical protein CVU37_06895 [candidate division BRC1 bacterium HGW-BRC1-1]
MSSFADLLGGLATPRNYRSRRFSSYDTTGANRDWVVVPAGEKKALAQIDGPGIIKHIWMTVNCTDPLWPRALVLRAYWDGEESPSIEAPIGDFFGVGHGKVANYMSLPMNMVSGGATLDRNQAAMNCFLPMPFRKGARIEVENQSGSEVQALYYYIDYEEHDSLPEDTLTLHAWWNRENLTQGMTRFDQDYDELFVKTCNITGEGNYDVVKATGRGHYIGCTLHIRNVQYNNTVHTWFGEGDDMIFVDGEAWPPALHGTGTEDYFCAAWGFPSGAYDGPFHGISLAGNKEDWSGEWSMYRWHLESPVTFTKSIRVTLEHGHANTRWDDWSSVGYWYQAEPHAAFDSLLPEEKRRPRPKGHWEKP